MRKPQLAQRRESVLKWDPMFLAELSELVVRAVWVEVREVHRHGGPLVAGGRVEGDGDGLLGWCVLLGRGDEGQ